MNANTSTFEQTELLLAEAGIPATQVESCHDGNCRHRDDATFDRLLSATSLLNREKTMD